MTKATTPPAPSLQGKTPPLPDAEEFARRHDDCATADGQEVHAPEHCRFAADLAALVAAIRVAALEEAARLLDRKEYDCWGLCADAIRRLASSPAPAKRAETEGGGDGA